MFHRINSAVHEAYQAIIGQRILTSNLRVHLNPNFKLSRLHTVTYLISINTSQGQNTFISTCKIGGAMIPLLSAGGAAFSSPIFLKLFS